MFSLITENSKETIEMLSPKMQRTIRINENQLVMLSERARDDHSHTGYLHKRSADSSKWQLRWFVLYQVCLWRTFKWNRSALDCLF